MPLFVVIVAFIRFYLRDVGYLQAMQCNSHTRATAKWLILHGLVLLDDVVSGAFFIVSNIDINPCLATGFLVIGWLGALYH